jgi:hypothetical protein
MVGETHLHLFTFNFVQRINLTAFWLRSDMFLRQQLVEVFFGLCFVYLSEFLRNPNLTTKSTMNTKKRFLNLVIIMTASSFATAQDTPPSNSSPDNWQRITSVEEVVTAFDDEMDHLLAELDLSRPDLKAVKRAHNNGNKIEAAKALLASVRNGNSGAWLREDTEPGHDEVQAKTRTIADNILNDIYRGFGEQGRVPRLENGHLDWTHLGPKNDIQFSCKVNRHQHLSTLLQAYWAIAPKFSWIRWLPRIC